MARVSYAYLLEDADVRRWCENVARGSRVTADVYLRRLDFSCQRMVVTPRRLSELGDRDVAALVMDMFSGLEREGKAGSYIKSCIRLLGPGFRST